MMKKKKYWWQLPPPLLPIILNENKYRNIACWTTTPSHSKILNENIRWNIVPPSCTTSSTTNKNAMDDEYMHDDMDDNEPSRQ